MESENADVVGSGEAPVNSRWNPTKEQISALENLYKQGIRTPSAEQIQQITSRLKAYGHIEGKNVFYWFQNHKARQRQKQKQKQESMVFVNHYLYNKSHQPFLESPCPNAICSPYYPPNRDLGLYPQYPKVMHSGGFKRRSRAEMFNETKANKSSASFFECNATVMPPNAKNQKRSVDERQSKQETLSLFPLLPTGLMSTEGIATSMSSLGSSSAQNFASSTSTGAGLIEEGSGIGSKPFFDFFSGHHPCESE